MDRGWPGPKPGRQEGTTRLHTLRAGSDRPYIEKDIVVRLYFLVFSFITSNEVLIHKELECSTDRLTRMCGEQSEERWSLDHLMEFEVDTEGI